jgi:hypothetical protein
MLCWLKRFSHQNTATRAPDIWVETRTTLLDMEIMFSNITLVTVPSMARVCTGLCAVSSFALQFPGLESDPTAPGDSMQGGKHGLGCPSSGGADKMVR